MDGRKPTFGKVLLAALTLAGQPALLRSDDFIRQPALARAQADKSSGNAAAPAGLETGHGSQVSRGTKAVLASSTQSLQRGDLAAEISRELVSGGSQLGPRSTRVVAASLEPGPGWQAVGDDLVEHVTNCERLLSRSAYLSAMEEARRGILRLARVLDLRQNKLASEPAWAEAQQALREALEFTTHQRIANDADLFTRIIQSHETPALHQADIKELTPLAAAQHYRAYAEKRLVEASQGHPWFSELYYCMGRALESQATEGHPQADALLQEALTYYRSAHAIEPNNAANSNQLSYVLLRMDRPGEALAQLVQTVRAPDCPLEAWQNLVEASARVNNHQAEQWARQNYLALKQQGVAPASESGTLVEVDPRQFAAMSPYASGPQVQSQSAAQVALPAPSQVAAPSQVSTPSPASGSAAATPRTATAPKSGWFR